MSERPYSYLCSIGSKVHISYETRESLIKRAHDEDRAEVEYFTNKDQAPGAILELSTDVVVFTG